jgi:hypothetical protein
MNNFIFIKKKTFQILLLSKVVYFTFIYSFPKNYFGIINKNFI